jgi:hypothetical protein
MVNGEWNTAQLGQQVRAALRLDQVLHRERSGEDDDGHRRQRAAGIS